MTPIRTLAHVWWLGCAVLTFAPESGAAADRAVAPVASVSVRGFVAGGRDQPLELAGIEPAPTSAGPATQFLSHETARIPLIAQPLIFHLGPNPQTPTEAMRMQYRLEGWDDEWQDLDGIMFLALRFLDADGRRISSVSLPRRGSSAGWTGDPEAHGCSVMPLQVRLQT